MAATGPLIAICCNSFPPEGGGASGRIYNMAVLLRDAGYRVQVLCAMPNYPTGKIFPAYRGKLVTDEVVDGIAVRRVWMYPSNAGSAPARGLSMMSFVVSLKLFGFAFVRRKSPALVIVSSPPLLMASACTRYFKRKGFPVLLNVSDLWPLSASALGALKEQAIYRRLEEQARRMYEAASAITAQSNETLAHIQQQCGRMPPNMLYRNLPSTEQVLGAISLSAGTTKIIYPGLLGHAQGILALCQHIDFKAAHAELHIYGKGAELELLKQWLAGSGQDVYLHEPVSPGELASLLGSFHALLVPLTAPIEGALPSKLFTAAQVGIPVLYSGGGEGELLVQQYELGYVAAPGDYATISSQIKTLGGISIEKQLQWRAAIRETAAAMFDKKLQDKTFISFVAALIQLDQKIEADHQASLNTTI